MAHNTHCDFSRPGWNQAAAWFGSDFFGLTRLLLRNGLRIDPAVGVDCSIDVLVSLLNTGLGGLQGFYYGPRLRRVVLPPDPVFIIGHWRTGTTLLHELLAMDPRNRCPTTFECFVPNHFLILEPLVRGWIDFLLPGSRPTDAMAMGWDQPQEDEFALCNLGIPSPYATMAFPNRPPQFPEYLDLDRVGPAQRQRWKRAFGGFLRQLLCKRPGRLVLKSPTHTFRLPILLEMFPKARFVHIVRNPYKVFPSTVHLWKSLYAWQAYQKPTYEGLDERVLDTFVRMHERLEATRGRVEPARFHELRYEDLVRDPVGQMRTLYERFALGPFEPIEPAVRGYFAARADYRTNHYELPQQQRDTICRRWGYWIDRYGYGP